MTRQKSPNPTDKHVGTRVRMRRMMLGMSQTALGDALDITFQQVQKYEKGTNRISASRLQQICHTLQVPVPFFFEGLPDAPAPVSDPKEQHAANQCMDFMATRDGLALAKAFMRIANVEMRRRIVSLVEEIEEHQDCRALEM
jgi:transcriptional regulator with XRE-family HTH domain